MVRVTKRSFLSAKSSIYKPSREVWLEWCSQFELWILKSVAAMIALSGYDAKIWLIESERLTMWLKVESLARLGLLLYIQSRNVQCVPGLWILTIRQKIRCPTKINVADTGTQYHCEYQWRVAYEGRRPTEMCNHSCENPVDLHPHILGFHILPARRAYGYTNGRIRRKNLLLNHVYCYIYAIF